MDFQPVYLGVRMAMAGGDPYRVAAIQDAFDAYHASGAPRIRHPSNYPDDCYYPPQLLLLVAPLARLPWTAAVVGWLAVQIAATTAVGWLIARFGREDDPPRPAVTAWVAVAVTLNCITLLCYGLGQMTPIVAAAVVVGHALTRRGRTALGLLAWSLVGIKPQLAIAFLALALYLEGPRRTAVIVALIVLANVLGCVVLGGRLGMLADYARFVVATQGRLAFNRAESFHLVSWNHAVYALTGRSIEPSIGVMLAGLAAWAGLLHLRLRAAGSRWTPAYALAAAALGDLVCARAHGYDMMLLALLTPWLLTLRDGRRRGVAALAVGLIAIALVVPNTVIEGAVHRLALHGPLRELVLSYRGWIVLGLAACLVLAPPEPAGVRSELARDDQPA